MLRLAYEGGKVRRLLVIRQVKESAPRQGFFELAPYLAVRAKLSEDLQGAGDRARLRMALSGEALTLERRQLDFEAGALRLDPGMTKNDDGRLVRRGGAASAMASWSGGVVARRRYSSAQGSAWRVGPRRPPSSIVRVVPCRPPTPRDRHEDEAHPEQHDAQEEMDEGAAARERDEGAGNEERDADERHRLCWPHVGHCFKSLPLPSSRRTAWICWPTGQASSLWYTRASPLTSEAPTRAMVLECQGASFDMIDLLRSWG
jgi:hypothetical protein